MTTSFALMTSLVVIAGILWFTVRAIVQDRPNDTHKMSAQDWRADQLMWHRLGIR